jgi:hypothetical protein
VFSGNALATGLCPFEEAQKDVGMKLFHSMFHKFGEIISQKWRNHFATFAKPFRRDCEVLPRREGGRTFPMLSPLEDHESCRSFLAGPFVPRRLSPCRRADGPSP